jgi:peptidoglycan/xylan/chitin deacetylase (PgdA/CDA1 family)
MSGWKDVIAGSLCGAFRLTRGTRTTAAARVLMYHAVGTPIPDDAQGRYTITPERFRSHMDALVQNKVPVVDFPCAADQPQQIAITFDDGYRDTLEVAAPLMVERKLPFCVFVTPGFVRSGNGIYLSESGLRELAALPGAMIGAHGDSHCRLTECDDAKLKAELRDSRAWLEDVLGRAVTTMSYPHGAVDRRVRDAAAEAGYVFAACSVFGARRAGDDPLAIARTDIWASDDAAVLEAKLAGDWDWLGTWQKLRRFL